MLNRPMSSRVRGRLVLAAAVILALGLQGCVATVVGTAVGVTGAAIGATAKVGGAAVGAVGHVVTGGDHKKDKKKHRRGDDR